jgi:hypothetical protein
MAATVESLIKSFPYPTFAPIVGEPTYETITAVTRQLKANAASVHSELGGGALGHLALIMTPAVYATISVIPFAAPGNPGPTPVIPAGNPTGAIISATIRNHTEALRIWRLYNNVDKALKQQLIRAVTRMYIRTLEDPHIGFANVTTLMLLQHLLTTYGRITEHALHTNDSVFKSSMDPSQPFETFISQIEDTTEYAAAGNTPYTAAQVIANAYTIVYNTGLFADASREWRRRPLVDKTWPNFKIHFAEAHNDYRLTQTTAQAAGYHSANNVMDDFVSETADAFANLATATASDRTMMAELTQSNSELLRQLAAQTTEIQNLRSQLASQSSGGNNGAGASSRNQQDHNNRGRGRVRYNNNENYCWTHGYDVADTHRSDSCTNPGDGHKKEATRANTLGGSNRNRGLVM